MAEEFNDNDTVIVNEAKYDDGDELDVSPDSPFNELAESLAGGDQSSAPVLKPLIHAAAVKDTERRQESRYPIYHSALIYRKANAEAIKVFVFNLSRTGVGVAVSSEVLAVGEAIIIELNSPGHFAAPVLLEGKVVAHREDLSLKYGKEQVFGIELENLTLSNQRHLENFVEKSA